MNAVEFVLWLNGACDMVEGSEPPTPEQWAVMKDRLGDAVGEIVASKLLETAQEQQISRKQLFENRGAEYQRNVMRHQVAGLATSVMPMKVTGGTLIGS